MKQTVEKFNLIGFIIQYSLYMAFLVIFIIFCIISPSFLTVGNLFNILNQAGVLIVLALGVTFVILTVGIDLSTASVLACSSVIGAVVMRNNQNIILGVGTIIAVAVVFGFINGLAVVKLNIPPLITTLAVMNICRGIGLVLTKGYSVYNLPEAFIDLGWGFFWKIPKSIFVVLFIFVVLNFVLLRTSYGRKLYAVGGSRESARIMGINVELIILFAYIICGLTAGLAGILMTSRLGAARASMATGMELQAIASAVIGGTSLFGGQGALIGTLVGAILIAIINNGLNLLGLHYYYQIIFTGVIILVAVEIDHLKNR